MIINKFIMKYYKNKRNNVVDVYKSFIIVIGLSFIVTFLRLFYISNFYISIFIMVYILLSLYFIFFTKLGKYKIFRNKYYEKYYEDYLKAAEILNIGILFFVIYFKKDNSFSFFGLIFILIALIFPYFSKKNWKD